MQVLVTGGAGYIGSHACKELALQGFTPITFDNFSRGHRWAVRYGPLEEGDLLDRDRLDQVFRNNTIEAVLHFAAFALVGESVQKPEMYYRNNFVGSLNLIEAMVAHSIPALVFSSTCATYGVPATPTIREDHPQVPINPYGQSKLMVEQALRDFGQAHNLRSVALRYFNAAGSDAQGELGEEHDPETHLIPNVMRAALGELDHLTVFGQDYPTPDGTCIRDYIHVSDLATAHIQALKRLAQGQPLQRAYNLGTGQGLSVREIIDGVEAISGRPVPLQIGPRRPGDPPRLVAEASLAYTELEWRPQFSQLENILKTSWGWHSTHPSKTP